MHLVITKNYMFRTASLLYSCDNELRNENLFNIYTFWEKSQFNVLDQRLS